MRSHVRPYRTNTPWLISLFGLVLASCSSPSDNGTPRAITALTGPTAGFTVGRGFTTSGVIAITRSSTFDGDVQLAAEGLPQGITASFAPATLNSTSTLSEMTIIAVSSATPGSYTFTIRATGAGVTSKTVSVPLQVSDPTIGLTASVASVTLNQATEQTIPLTITRTGGFAGTVGLAVLGLPEGVTGVITPAALEAGAVNATLTLSAPLTAALGVSALTIRASAQGLEDRTIPMQLTITPTTIPAVLVDASPRLVQLLQGASAQTEVSVQRLAGFQGAVTIAIDALPANITAVSTPIAAGSNTTMLQINAGVAAAFGPSTVTLRATGAGIQPSTRSISIQVVVAPNFLLLFQLVPSTAALDLTITRGSSAPVNFSVGRLISFNEAVTLSLEGLPAGVTTTFPTTAPSATNTQSLPFTISVAPGTVPGVYPLTLRGVATGGLVRTATIALTVQ